MKTSIKNLFVIILFASAFIKGQVAMAQVGINTLLPNSSSMLDISSTNKGLLIPRMTSIQRLGISAPATGLMVYETTTNQFFYFDGLVWKPLASSTTGWSVTGNAGTVAGTNFLGTTGPEDLVVKTNNTENLRVTASGNVGIGTNLPVSKLEVVGQNALAATSGSAQNGIARLQPAGSALAIDMGASGAFPGHGWIQSRDKSNYASHANFSLNPNGGNVAVGNIAPASKLHVTKSGVSGISPDINAVITAENNSTGYINIVTPSTNENGVLFGIGGGFSPSANNGGIIYNSSGTRRGFQFRTDGNLTKMVLDSNGRVGIGITSLIAKLDVLVSTSLDTIVYRGRNSSASGTTTQIGSIEWFKDFSNTIDFNNNNNSAQFSINLDNNATHDLQLAFDDAAKPGTNTWTISSDARLKDDVKTFKDGLETIENINPVYYQYNGKANTPRGQYYVGVLAQDLQKATPYMVGSFEHTPDARNLENRETYLSVNNGALTYILVNAVKELNEKATKTNDVMENITDFGMQQMSGNELTVNFSSSFSSRLAGASLPVVTVSAVNSQSQVSVKNISSTGFTIVSSDPTIQVSWIAAGKLNQDLLKISKQYTVTERDELISKVKVKNATIRTAEEAAETAKRKSAGEIE